LKRVGRLVLNIRIQLSDHVHAFNGTLLHCCVATKFRGQMTRWVDCVAKVGDAAPVAKNGQ